MSYVKRHDTVLVSASLGGIDRVPHLPPGRGYDAIFYTDAQTVERSDPAAIASWDLVVTPPFPRRDWHPRLRAKYFRMQFHRLDEIEPYEYFVWMDARLNVIDHTFILVKVAALRLVAPWRRLSIFGHPERADIDEEFAFIQQSIAGGDPYLIVRYADEDMAGQLAHYRSKGWPMTGRLLASGFFIIENSPLMTRCFDEWWDHTLRFTLMDQLALPVVLARHHIEPDIIPGNIYDNPIVKFGWHDVVM